MDFQGKKFRKNPYAQSSHWSKLFFFWLHPLLLKANRKHLNIDDLYNVPNADEAGTLGDELERAWNKECDLAKMRDRQPKLYKALFSIYWRQYLPHLFSSVVAELIFKMGETFLLRLFIASLATKEGSSTVSMEMQYCLAGGIVLSNFAHTLLLAPSVFECRHLGMKCRLATSSLIYRKSLRLTSAGEGDSRLGQIINLLSNDVNRFDLLFTTPQNLIIGPMQTIIFGYFLWTTPEMKTACLVGGLSTGILCLGLVYSTKFLVRYRRVAIQRTDSRAQIMNQIVAGIRLIKLYAWEKPFSEMVEDIRRLEVSSLKKAASVHALCTYTVVLSASKITTYLNILTIILMGGRLRADQVFFIVAVSNVLLQNMANMFSWAVGTVREFNVSCVRFEEFLLLRERDGLIEEPRKRKMEKKFPEPRQPVKASVIMTGVSTSWTGTKTTLENIWTNLSGDKIVIIVGPLGSGKTSILQTLISELPLTQGKFKLRGKIGYISQDSWIFPGSIKRNILFDKNFDDDWYTRVIAGCALAEDFDQFPFRDESMVMVGERGGVVLSGGQKARVNLARAVYRDDDIYLMDDPLSAVDLRVANHIFEHCIQKMLKGKLRLLVTHQLWCLPYADHVIILNEGKILAQGTHSELLKQGLDFERFIGGSLEEEVDKNEKNKFNQVEELLAPKNFKKMDTTSSEEKVIKKWKTETPPSQPNEEEEDILIENAGISWNLYLKYLTVSNSLYRMTFILLGCLFSQLLSSYTDYWLSYWTRQTSIQGVNCEEINPSKIFFNLPKNLSVLQSSSQIQSLGSSSSCSQEIGKGPPPDDLYYLCVYSGLVFGSFVMMVVRAILSLHYCIDLSSYMHNQMLAKVVRAQTKFFDKNPSGKILTRFVKDVGYLDNAIPMTMVNSFSVLLHVAGTLILIALSNNFLVILLPAIGLIMVLVMTTRFYTKTARQVTRIGSKTKGQILTHLTATVKGLATIRASKSESTVLRQFDDIQDLDSTTWFTFIAATRWLCVWIDVISGIFVTIVTFSSPSLAQWVGSDQVGLAVTSALTFSLIIRKAILSWIDTDNQMTSVSRIFAYCQLGIAEEEEEVQKNGDKNNNLSLPPDWPVSGAIKFSHVSLVHDGNKVLKNLNFEVRPKEKIGIVGRTGAGKSSIVAVLFRLYEVSEGQIFVDGVSTRNIELQKLRQKLSVIPQDPMLFSGSVRYNLDPFHQFSDSQLTRVIKQVQLQDVVTCLSMKVMDGGSNFSAGQKQLLCLGRAILRQNSILIMDEATANVDPVTDELIQRLVRTQFDCTLIIIAHRLASVMDCDRVLVLDKGSIKEFDQPHQLLQNPNGFLSSLASGGEQVSYSRHQNRQKS